MPTYSGTSNNDFLSGSSAADWIYGYGGNDTLLGMDGADYIDGGDGADTIIDNDGNSPDLFADTLHGGNGDDWVFAGYLDNAYGGSGFDTLILRLDYAPGAVSIDFSGIWAGSTYTISGATISGFEGFHWITGSQYDDVMISGTPTGRSSELSGLAGNDVLIGGAGTDYLTAHGLDLNDIYYDEVYGGNGDDVLSIGIGDYADGGSGNDRLVLDIGLSGTGLNLNFAALLALGSATLAGASIISVEDIGRVSGSAYNDVLNAGTDTYATRLEGRDGDDTLVTGSGPNTLDGGVGADHMTGGAGHDEYIVDNIGDVVVEYAGGGNDLVRSSISYTLGSEVEQLVLTGAAAIDGTGNSLDNNMFGNGANNTLWGGAGSDTMNGEGGDDIVIGGAGRDLMTGGTGADTFVFADGDFAGLNYLTSDRIYDFSQAQGDRIRLDGVDAVAGGADDAFSFIGTGAFTGVAGQLRYGFVSGTTVIYGDTNGDGVEDLMITLTGTHTLTGSDFFL
jgi:serralysin